MVVNTIITAMIAQKLQPCNQITIYHVGSSTRNSMRHVDFQCFNYQYFTKKPLMDRDGNVIKVGKVRVFNNMTNFRRYIAIRYLIFLKVHLALQNPPLLKSQCLYKFLIFNMGDVLKSIYYYLFQN